MTTTTKIRQEKTIIERTVVQVRCLRCHEPKGSEVCNRSGFYE